MFLLCQCGVYVFLKNGIKQVQTGLKWFLNYDGDKIEGGSLVIFKLSYPPV